MISQPSSVDRDLVEELAEYRPLSFAAIAAVLLLLPGCLGVFHSGFLIFPVVAIVLALIALRQIATSSSGLSGGRAALAALGLSILLICFSITLHTLNSRREYYYAAHCAERWLQLLRGENPREAFLLTMSYDQRPAGANEAVQTEFGVRTVMVNEGPEKFMEQVEIVALADPANPVKLTGLANRIVTGKRATYRLVFDLHAPKFTPPDYFAIVEAMKTPGVDGGTYWQIGGCQLIAKNSGEPIR